VSPTPGVFCKQYEMTFQQLRNGRFSPNSATTRESWVKRRFWTEIYEKFPFRGHLPPKPQTWRGSNRHLTQSRLQVKGSTAERYCSFHVVVQGPGSFRSRSTFLYDVRLQSYGASKLPDFCRLKAYVVFTFLDSFQNKSGKPQQIRTKVGTHAQVKGRQRS